MRKQRYDDSRVSYQSKYTNTDLHAKADVFVGNHVPMNSISAGHPVMGEPELDVAKVRKMMIQAAEMETKK